MTPKDCAQIASSIFDHVAGRTTGGEKAAIEAHLEDCAACRKLVAEERVVAGLLGSRLPRHSAPEALKLRLAAAGNEATSRSVEAVRGGAVPRRSATSIALMAAAVFVAAAALLVFFVVEQRRRDADDRVARVLVTEAVNDHLRVLYAERPVEIESGGIHQVKPWFAGRLDFAPVVAFDGDDKFVLKGGSVGYFVDRKAAVFHYKLRLHSVSLFVFPAEGLPWAEGTVPVGPRRAAVSSVRGFHILLLRNGDLGYAIVSDAGTPELVELMGKVVGSAH
jgi:anti-sigma factor RsiW